VLNYDPAVLTGVNTITRYKLNLILKYLAELAGSAVNISQNTHKQTTIVKT
jgi:hypothetical protein